VWGRRIVSESTLTSHINAVRRAIGDSGGEQRLVRTLARKGFRFVGDVREAESSKAAASPQGMPPASNDAAVNPPALPDRPSIAALPFVNLSGDPEQEYFADGVVEDIISALSRIGWLFVIARNSSFTYKGRVMDVKQVGRELGVRYVLEGSVRKAANRVRITGQLIDASTGTNIWADRFEGTLDDIFELQDQVATSVVGAISPQLERAEIERARRKPTESLDAYDYYLRAVRKLHEGSRESIDEALRLFLLAIQLDADFASAYAMAAWCHFWRKVNGWMGDRPREIAEGIRLARRAVALGKDDAVALTRSGHALAHLAGEVDGGVALLDRALMLNPNLAAAWFLGGFLRAWRGESDAAIEHFARAMRLSPLDPETYRMQAGMAAAHLFARRYDAASAWAEKAVRDLPSFLMVVAVAAASHALAGRSAEARRAMDHLRRLDAGLRISNLGDWLPIRRPEDLASFIDGLRAAGLPE
jgi:TolB-like protein